VSAVESSLVDSIDRKDKDFFDEEAAKKYLKFSKRMSQFIHPSTNNLALYIDTVSSFCKSLSFINDVTSAAIHLNAKLASYTEIVSNKYIRHLKGKVNDEEESD